AGIPGEVSARPGARACPVKADVASVIQLVGERKTWVQPSHGAARLLGGRGIASLNQGRHGRSLPGSVVVKTDRVPVIAPRGAGRKHGRESASRACEARRRTGIVAVAR